MPLPSSVMIPLSALQSGPGASNAMRATSPAQQGAVPTQHAAPDMNSEFAGMLAVFMPDALNAASNGLAPAELPGNALARSAAFEGLTAEIEDLTASLIAEPGQIDPLEAIAQFTAILQQFDMATGANATQTLVINLSGLDPDGLAQLDAISGHPALLLGALSELAGLPKPEGFGAMFTSVAQKTPPTSARVPEGPTLAQGLIAESRVPGSLSPVEQEPLSGQQGGQLASGPPPSNPAASPVLRGMILAGLAGSGDGAQPDAVALPATLSEARPVSAGGPEIARPSEPSLPPPSGFARNLTQQIRSASFTDGQTRITLAPRGLGEIEIDMLPDEAGKLRIVLRAENPAVLQALRGDRDGLLLALADGGTNVEDANLDFEDFSRRHSRDGGAEQVPPGDAPGAVADEAATQSTPQPRFIGTGALDILT